MAFYIDLYMSCPCHNDYIPEKCQMPQYWYHNCQQNKISKKLQQVNQRLYLYCGICQMYDHIRTFNYYCEKYSAYMPYKNNSPQASIILSQQLANPKLSKEQRAIINALILNLLDES